MARNPAEDAPAPQSGRKMSADDAVAWLRQVGGELFRTPPNRRGRDAWVAVVRTSKRPGKRGRTIVAMGQTLEEAASAAAEQWLVLLQRKTLH